MSTVTAMAFECRKSIQDNKKQSIIKTMMKIFFILSLSLLTLFPDFFYLAVLYDNYERNCFLLWPKRYQHYFINKAPIVVNFVIPKVIITIVLFKFTFSKAKYTKIDPDDYDQNPNVEKVKLKCFWSFYRGHCHLVADPII